MEDDDDDDDNVKDAGQGKKYSYKDMVREDILKKVRNHSMSLP